MGVRGRIAVLRKEPGARGNRVVVPVQAQVVRPLADIREIEHRVPADLPLDPDGVLVVHRPFLIFPLGAADARRASSRWFRSGTSSCRCSGRASEAVRRTAGERAPAAAIVE